MHQNVIESGSLLPVEFVAIQGQIDRPVQDQPIQPLRMGGLRRSAANWVPIALAVQPEVLVAHHFHEGLQVLHRLLGAQVGQEFGVTHFCHAVLGEDAGCFHQRCFIFWSGSFPIRLIEGRCRLDALHASRPSDAALVEEHHVEMLRDAGIEGRSIAVCRQQAGGARSAVSGDEEPFALPARRQHRKHYLQRASIRIEVVKGDFECDAGEIALWARLAAQACQPRGGILQDFLCRRLRGWRDCGGVCRGAPSGARVGAPVGVAGRTAEVFGVWIEGGRNRSAGGRCYQKK